MWKKLPECVWLEQNVACEKMNGIHRVIDSYTDYPDYLSYMGGEVLVTSCGEKIELWWFQNEPPICIGSLEDAKKTGIQFCQICFLNG